MESTAEDLGKLKYSVAIEVPLDEMKPLYDSIYKQLRQTRLNGFRPGKHPKGWLDKRFKAAMHEEAVERVIPKYLEKACNTHSLNPATVPVIQALEYDRKTPLTATIHFEVAPPLPDLDYSKIKLERKEIEEVAAKDITKELEMLLKREEKLESKTGEDAVAEDGDWVTVDCEGTIDGESFEGSSSETTLFKLGDNEFAEFQFAVKGMKVDDEKTADVVLGERFDENAGKTAQYTFTLKELSISVPADMNDDFFERYGVSGEDELKERIEQNIQNRRESEVKNEYRISIRTQLPECYDAFDVPEGLLTKGKENVDNEIEAKVEQEEITEDEIEAKRQEAYEEDLIDLRMKFILESIGKKEQVPFNENEAAQEFIQLAQITGQSAEEFIQKPFGRNMYERILYRKQEEAILDRVTARVFGDPIEEPAEHEHVHDENCNHDHD